MFKSRFLKSLAVIAAVALSTQLTGCMGSIESNHVGLRTNFNGTVDEKIEGPGIFTKFVGHVDEYSLKDIAINLENMTPKAGDNLSLAELDVTVYYHVKSPQAVRSLALKRAGSSLQMAGSHIYAPAYSLVESVSKSEIADAVSAHDSLTIHKERDKLAAEIKKGIQDSLDKDDPAAFDISRVVIRQVKTDASIEVSIRNVVSKEKELEASKLQVAIAHSNAEATQQTANTLTPAFLQHEYNQALMKFAEHGGTVILDGSSSNKMINVGK